MLFLGKKMYIPSMKHLIKWFHLKYPTLYRSPTDLAVHIPSNFCWINGFYKSSQHIYFPIMKSSCKGDIPVHWSIVPIHIVLHSSLPILSNMIQFREGIFQSTILAPPINSKSSISSIPTWEIFSIHPEKRIRPNQIYFHIQAPCPPLPFFEHHPPHSLPYLHSSAFL